MDKGYNRRFSRRFGEMRQTAEKVVAETGGHVALIAYHGQNNHCTDFGRPSVEAALDQGGFEPNPAPLALIDRARVATHLPELSPVDFVQLDNHLKQIRLSVRNEQRDRLGGNQM